MENLVNFIKQHPTKDIFEPIQTTSLDYAVAGFFLEGIGYEDCNKICKELNELLAKLTSVPQANELLPHVSGSAYNWDKCTRSYKQIGKFGTNQNICLNLTHKQKCEFHPNKCDAKSYNS